MEESPAPRYGIVDETLELEDPFDVVAEAELSGAPNDDDGSGFGDDVPGGDSANDSAGVTGSGRFGVDPDDRVVRRGKKKGAAGRRAARDAAAQSTYGGFDGGEMPDDVPLRMNSSNPFKADVEADPDGVASRTTLPDPFEADIEADPEGVPLRMSSSNPFKADVEAELSVGVDGFGDRVPGALVPGDGGFGFAAEPASIDSLGDDQTPRCANPGKSSYVDMFPEDDLRLAYENVDIDCTPDHEYDTKLAKLVHDGIDRGAVSCLPLCCNPLL